MEEHSNMYVDDILNLYLRCNSQVQIAVAFTPFSRGLNIFFRSPDFPFVCSVVLYTIAIYLSIFCNAYLPILISILELSKALWSWVRAKAEKQHKRLYLRSSESSLLTNRDRDTRDSLPK